YRLSDRDILGHGGAYEFHVQPERIHCHLLDSEDLDRIALALLGSVMAYWLEVRGRIALHAAAVEVDGLAVAFLAGNPGGRSSLAATFMQAGFPLRTGHILPLEVGSDGRATGHPGRPQLRCWPEHGRALLGN